MKYATIILALAASAAALTMSACSIDQNPSWKQPPSRRTQAQTTQSPKVTTSTSQRQSPPAQTTRADNSHNQGNRVAPVPRHTESYTYATKDHAAGSQAEFDNLDYEAAELLGAILLAALLEENAQVANEAVAEQYGGQFSYSDPNQIVQLEDGTVMTLAQYQYYLNLLQANAGQYQSGCEQRPSAQPSTAYHDNYNNFHVYSDGDGVRVYKNSTSVNDDYNYSAGYVR